MKYKILFFLSALIVFHFFQLFVFQSRKEPQVLPLYEKFLIEGKKRGFTHLDKIQVQITFSETLSQERRRIASDGTSVHSLGSCFMFMGFQPKVTIDKNLWNNTSEAVREMVLFHELAHCLLIKGHTTGHENGKTKSLMNDMIFSEQQYWENRNYYLDELFSIKPYHVKDSLVTFLNPITLKDNILHYSKKYWTKTKEYSSKMMASIKN